MDWIPFIPSVSELHVFWLSVVFVLGLGLLIGGGDGLLRGSSALALRGGISPLIIGLTVVSFATSLPELVVSILSVLAEKADLAVGNIVGSNIANLGAILGIAAVWRAIPTHQRLVRFDLPFLIAATFGFWVLSMWGSTIGRWDAVLLLTPFIAYIVFIVISHRDTAVVREMIHEIHPPRSRLLTCFLWILAGAVGLFIGADLLVGSASEMAQRMGVREAWIGLTLVAIGTSLPEWVTTIIGVWRRQTELVLGNLIGSNLFNLALIGGLTAVVIPIPVSRSFLSTEMPLMVLITLLAAWFLFSGRILSRKEGLGLVAIYLFFLGLTSLHYWS